ncbi:MAG: ATPase P [Alkalispirochaetaceae bacterium]
MIKFDIPGDRQYTIENVVCDFNGTLAVDGALLPGVAEAKAELVDRLGAESTAAIGNGRNDFLMLRAAAIGICVLQREGAYRETLQAADIVCASPVDALELLLNPKRLIATLRR